MWRLCVRLYTSLCGAVCWLLSSVSWYPAEFSECEQMQPHIFVVEGRTHLTAHRPLFLEKNSQSLPSSQWLTCALSVGLLIFFIYFNFYCSMHFIEGIWNQTHNISEVCLHLAPLWLCGYSSKITPLYTHFVCFLLTWDTQFAHLHIHIQPIVPPMFG